MCVHTTHTKAYVLSVGSSPNWKQDSAGVELGQGKETNV